MQKEDWVYFVSFPVRCKIFFSISFLFFHMCSKVTCFSSAADSCPTFGKSTEKCPLKSISSDFQFDPRSRLLIPVTFIILKRPLLFFRRKTSWSWGVGARGCSCRLRSGTQNVFTSSPTKGCTSYRLMKSSPTVSLLCFAFLFYII